MIGAYDAMMRSGQMGGQPNRMGAQAMPVHHVGKGSMEKPEQGSISAQYQSFLAEVENEMKKYPPSTGAYKQLFHLRGQILSDIGDMDTEHMILERGPDAVDPKVLQFQDLQRRANPYKRGVDPTGQITR